MDDVTSATAKILQLEQKRLPYGTRPFLLLRRVWLARLHTHALNIYSMFPYKILARLTVQMYSLSVQIPEGCLFLFTGQLSKCMSCTYWPTL